MGFKCAVPDQALGLGTRYGLLLMMLCVLVDGGCDMTTRRYCQESEHIANVLNCI